MKIYSVSAYHLAPKNNRESNILVNTNKILKDAAPVFRGQNKILTLPSGVTYEIDEESIKDFPPKIKENFLQTVRNLEKILEEKGKDYHFIFSGDKFSMNYGIIFKDIKTSYHIFPHIKYSKPDEIREEILKQKVQHLKEREKEEAELWYVFHNPRHPELPRIPTVNKLYEELDSNFLRPETIEKIENYDESIKEKLKGPYSLIGNHYEDDEGFNIEGLTKTIRDFKPSFDICEFAYFINNL